MFSLQAFADDNKILVNMQTNMGTIILELNKEKAPNSVKNFVEYTKSGFYDGTIFHRVINNFMVQGGGFTKDFKQKDTGDAVKNEAKNGLKNVKGSVAMARTRDPHSATAQFFINVNDNKFLDYPGQDGWGYAVFGKVTKGMEVINKMKSVNTGSGGPFPSDVPKKTIIIEKVTLVDNKKVEPNKK
jgi:cyclophilin family peptidyl-prolyl cis-trans isomerase